jgi:hypothetical protein
MFWLVTKMTIKVNGVEKPSTRVAWPWREFATSHGLGINKVRADIASGVLKARVHAGRNFITLADAMAYVESLPLVEIGKTPKQFASEEAQAKRAAGHATRRRQDTSEPVSESL